MNSGWQHDRFGVHYCRPTPESWLAAEFTLPMDCEKLWFFYRKNPL
jgi:hypothetical protein